MRQTNKIPLTTLLERLSTAMNYPLGMNHLAVLIHGWMKKRPLEAPTVTTMRVRKKREGFAWLSPSETADFSRYAGYDLTKA